MDDIVDISDVMKAMSERGMGLATSVNRPATAMWLPDIVKGVTVHWANLMWPPKYCGAFVIRDNPSRWRDKKWMKRRPRPEDADKVAFRISRSGVVGQSWQFVLGADFGLSGETTACFFFASEQEARKAVQDAEAEWAAKPDERRECEDFNRTLDAFAALVSGHQAPFH